MTGLQSDMHYPHVCEIPGKAVLIYGCLAGKGRRLQTMFRRYHCSAGFKYKSTTFSIKAPKLIDDAVIRRFANNARQLPATTDDISGLFICNLAPP